MRTQTTQPKRQKEKKPATTTSKRNTGTGMRAIAILDAETQMFAHCLSQNLFKNVIEKDLRVLCLNILQSNLGDQVEDMLCGQFFLSLHEGRS